MRDRYCSIAVLPLMIKRSIALTILMMMLQCIFVECRDNAGSTRHSNFFKSTYNPTRSHYVSCANNATVCLDLNRNPTGGSSCCSNKYCKDTNEDPYHCGFCGHTCGYGMSCCHGFCVNLSTDANNCGGCNNQCPQNDQCSFGMCEYAGDEGKRDDGDGNDKQGRKKGGPKHR